MGAFRSLVLTCAAVCATAVAIAQQPPAGAPPDRAAQERQAAEINARADTPGTGRFPAMKEEVPSLPRHVVYRPKDLGALGGQKLGVVAWGNGGCSDDGASSRFHLLEIASHGYLVIASGRILSGPGAPPREPRPAAEPGSIPPARTQVSDLTEAVDWALAENQRRGSAYFGRIDPSLVAYSGWSCGGLQALQVAKDPRVKTLVLHNTGVFNDGPSTIPGMDVGKDVLQTLHTPVIYILGGPTDIAYANGMDDFKRIAHVPVAVANLPVGHGGTFNQPNGGAAASVAVSWLEWQLRGDTTSAKRFVGEECGLCQDSQWSVQRKQFAAAAATTASAQAIKVDTGLVEGTVEDGLRIYRGIPYAAPPVGNLRWRAPQPAAKWDGVRAAKEFGRACPQTNAAISNLPAPSEDCLFVNVWTPARDAERLPVMVWIHGGGFVAGTPAEQLYHGEWLAKKGVVVVSVAYRLGVFGFLAHPELTAESEHHVSGNYGLLDVIAGLRWVQKNIAAFGGDPGKVTIFGESAGGIAVSQLAASPLAKGLFHGAISESGGSFGPIRAGGAGPGENMQGLATAEKDGAAWGTSIGASTLTALRSLPAEKMLAAAQRQRGIAWPITDGWVIPDDQYRLYEARKYHDVPVLIGYNSDEGASFGPPASQQAYVESVRQRYGQFADRLLAAYPGGDAPPAKKTARDLTRDTAFGWHTWTWARLQDKTGKSKVFLYYFDEHPDYAADSPRAGFGSAHASELPYVFRQLREHNRPPATAVDEAMSDLLRTYWTNFAKTGDPNDGALPKWPAFTSAAPQMLQIKTGATKAIPVMSAEGLKVLDDYFAWRRESSSHASSAKTITSAECTAARLGAGVPASAIGEPVRSVTLSVPAWVEAANGTPAHCRVDGVMAPISTDATARPINFRVVLPAAWNERAAQLGGGGMNGIIPNLTGAPPGGAPSVLERGLATYGSDSGHQMAFGRGRGAVPPGTNLSDDWTLNEEAIANLGYAQMKKTHDAAMVLIERMYGERPRFNYYIGTSQGGREALTMAQRYPADYDGVAANVPIVGFSSLMLAPELIRIEEKPLTHWVTPAKINAIRGEFIRQCDELDGLADGIINNYVACRALFDVTQGAKNRHPWAAKRCPNDVDPNPSDTSGAACLTSGQISTLEFVYSRYKFATPLANGTQTFGMWLPNTDPSGSGLILKDRFAGQEGAPAGAPMHAHLGVLGVTGFLMKDLSANPLDYKEGGTFDHRRHELSAILDATNPDLSAFQKRGGKMIVTIGTNDTLASPGTQLDYYQSVVDKMGRTKVDQFARLFVMPQTGHGLSGTNYNVDGKGREIPSLPIPNRYDQIALLFDWVEHGVAPGMSVTVTAAEKSLPLCSYPTYPKYRTGPPAAATSYVCTQP